MAIRKLGTVTGSVTGVEGDLPPAEGVLPPRTATREGAWEQADDEALAAENDQADA